MAIRQEHELHQRRLGRNVGLGVALVTFVALIYALTVAKTWEKYQPEQPASVSSES